MRIQHLIHTPRYSGAEVLVSSLTLAHNKMGHQSSVVAFAPAESDFTKVIVKQQSNDIEWLIPETNLKGLARSAHFRYAQKKFGPDVIFAHSVIPAAYARLGLIRNVISVLHAENNYKSNILTAAEYILQYRLKGVIHISPLAGTLYSDKFRAPKTQCIPNGIDIGLISEAQQNRSAVRNHFGFKDSAKVFIQAGRICRIKGQTRSIKAIAPILKSEIDSHFLIAGLIEDITYLNELKEIARSEGIENKVHFLGARDDIPNLLHAADIFLMPSEREAQGIALVEALAAGLPVIASDINGFHFAREFEGVELVNTEDTDSYRAAINHLTCSALRYNRNLAGYDITDTATAYIEFAKKCIY